MEWKLFDGMLNGTLDPQISCDPLDKSINLTLHLKVTLNSNISVIHYSSFKCKKVMKIQRFRELSEGQQYHENKTMASSCEFVNCFYLSFLRLLLLQVQLVGSDKLVRIEHLCSSKRVEIVWPPIFSTIIH